MASKKSNVPATAPSTPFATSSGFVPGGTDSSGRPGADFTKSAKSATPTVGGRNFAAESGPPRTQEAPEPAQAERTYGQGEQRAGLDASSIPSGGITTRADPTSGRGNHADAGPTPARSPFKNLK